MPPLNRPKATSGNRKLLDDLVEARNRGANLEKALAGVLRKIGLIGTVTPGYDRLLTMATDYANYRFTVATDLGEIETPARMDLEPGPNDKDLPF